MADGLLAQAKTGLYVAVGGQAAGLPGVVDTLRDTWRAAVAQLQQRGLEVVLLTGDNP